MKLFISDLHIGSPLFKREKEVMELLNTPEVNEIYILGDLLDTWEEDPFDTLKRMPDFIELINNKVDVIVIGNHDPAMVDMKKIFPKVHLTYRYEMEVFGKKTVLVHGDEKDDTQSWAKMWFPLHNMFQCFGLNLKAITRTVWTKAKSFVLRLDDSDLVLRMEKEIVKKYQDDYDLIIAGHTHLPRLARLKKVDYVNCGCMVCKPSYVVADKNTLIMKKMK